MKKKSEVCDLKKKTCSALADVAQLVGVQDSQSAQA